MKKTLLALSFVLASTIAQADTLSLLSYGSTTITGDINNVTGQGIGTNVRQGLLYANDPFQWVQFTYLGSEAANNNILREVLFGSDTLFNNWGSKVGDTAYIQAGMLGDLWFGFQDLSSGTRTRWNGSTSIAYLLSGRAAAAFGDGGYEFVLGFNDGNGIDRDFDDMVVGVKAVSAIPVPAALPLLASALGMFGIARRRKTQA